MPEFGPDEQWEREQAEEDAAMAVAKADENARVIAFVAELNALCAKHNMHVSAWATYADDSFFGVESSASKQYTVDLSSGSYEYSLEIVDA